MAITILLAWGIHLIYILSFQPVDVTDPWLWIHVILQTWLFTGLFITAHDSIHGTVTRNRTLNNTIGFISTVFYAGLWYPVLKKKHYLHHLYPATTNDPDYVTGNQNFFRWWYSFMKQYITIWQLLFMAVIFNIGLLFFSELQLIVLWITPSILSTFQLFFFGTFIPHRLPHTSKMEPHKARSQRRNHLWALVSCYFFGYHFEHHAYPQTPWWRLYRTKPIQNTSNN